MAGYQKLQTKGAYDDFVIRPQEIGDSPYAPGQMKGDSWVLGVVNTTNHSYELVSLRHAPGEYGAWFRVPAVGNNCPTGYDECFARQVWSEVLSLPAGMQSFDIRIATRPNDFGVAVGGEFLDGRPEPGTRGGVLGIAIDG